MRAADAHSADATDPRNIQKDQPHRLLAGTAGQSFGAPPAAAVSFPEAWWAWLSRRMTERKTPKATRPQSAA